MSDTGRLSGGEIALTAGSSGRALVASQNDVGVEIDVCMVDLDSKVRSRALARAVQAGVARRALLE